MGRVKVTASHLQVLETDLLDSFQSTFCQDLQETALVTLGEDVHVELNWEHVTATILLNLFVAFDILSSRSPLSCLLIVGLISTILRWLKSYVGGHFHNIILEDSFSSLLQSTCGVAKVFFFLILSPG